MSLGNPPLADVAISIQSIQTSPALTLSGIDLDSGRSVSLQISSDDLATLADQLKPQPPGLVLVLSLFVADPLVID
jgi:hypothetical protein